MAEPLSDVSIVIIGAGISGFTAAAKLLEKGFTNVTILEAESRIGGRVYTTEFAGGLVDLGAQWCHGIEGNLVHQLAGADAFAETKMDFNRMSFKKSNGSSADEKTCEDLMKLCEKILSELSLENVGTIDEILTEKFLESSLVKQSNQELAREILENFRKRESSYCGCESLKEINVDGYMKFRDCEGPTWLNWKGKGYRTIFDCVSNISRECIEKKVLLSRRVTSIDWIRPSKVEVKCDSGETFFADHVVVTVSLGVLKENPLTMFTPKLPHSKLRAIEAIQFGAVGKIFVEFERPFWPDDWVGFSLLWSEEDLNEMMEQNCSWWEDIYCFYTVNSMPNVLLGRLAGDKIEQMEGLTDDQMVRSCQRIFEKFIPNETYGRIVAVKTSKWKTSSNFKGTYSYQTKDDSSVTCHIATPLFDGNGKVKVLFAGEATHEHFFSTVHGAIETGVREAERITKIYCDSK